MINLPGSDLTIYRGEEKTYQGTITEGGTAVDLTGATVYFTVRNAWPAGTVVADTDALIKKTSASSIQIEITTPASGIFLLYLDSVDTKSFTLDQCNASYAWGVEYIPSGFTYPRVADQGKFIIYPDVVRAA